MAIDFSATPQPVVPANATPAPAATPPDITSAPNADLFQGLSGLANAPVTQPNNPEAIMGSQEGQGYTNAVAAQQAAVKRAQDAANAPLNPGAGGHERLLSMVQGLSLGLSSFGTALATKGAQGGAAEVAQIQGEQQRQKIEAQQMAMNQRNQQINQQLAVAGTNQILAQSYLNLLTLPDRIVQEHLQVQQGQQALAAGAQEQEARQLAMTAQKAEFTQQYGVSPKVWDALMSGNGTDGVTPQDVENFKSFIGRKIGAMSQILGANDPTVQQAQKVLGDPNASPADIAQANAAVTQAYGLRQDVLKNQQAATSVLPKNEQEAAAQLADAKSSGDPDRISRAQASYDAIHKSVEDERAFSAKLQQANQEATKNLAFAQKGADDIDKLWTDPQHGFSQTVAQINATKAAVAQAKNGSELAANLVPLMTALGVSSFAGVHRINDTEINQAGSQVGSLYRRLNAALDKAGSGSVPPETLQEVSSIMDSLAQNKYQSSLASTRQIVANSKIPANLISVPDPNNYNGLVTLDKVAAGGAAQGPDPFAQFGGRRHQ